MKTKLLGLVAGVLLVGGANVLRADLEVSAGVRVRAVAEFHAPLAGHGTWVEVRGHGNCWRPAGVAVDWRPYCVGQWVWTDCGWYWMSDEPWAWSCYHYGWWMWEPAFGWVWVPGIEWAPAWVSWRVGGGYCGWAPLAPRGVVIKETHYVFVEDRRFHEPVRPRTVIVNNTTIIKNTKVVSLKRESRSIAGARQTVMVNEGPGVVGIQKASGQKFVAAPIQEVARRTVRPQIATKDTGKTLQPGAVPTDTKPNDGDHKPDDGQRNVPGAPTDKVIPPPKDEVDSSSRGDKGEGPGKSGKAPGKAGNPGKGQGKGHDK